MNQKLSKLASDLRAARPAVLPGTNVIVNDAERHAWYDRVTHAMTENNVTTPQEIRAFCDACGVPD